MLKIIKSMSELQEEQLLSVYSGSNMNEKEERSFLDYLCEDFFRQRDGYYCLWTVDDVYKSALRLEPYRDGLLLQALETAPDARKKGYGFSLVKAVLEHCGNTKYKCVYSHVEKHNRSSLNLHRKCGFQKLADSAVLLDGTVTTNFYTFCYYL